VGTSPNKVLLFSGGGTGHEPAHVGFVGTGMLDVAVAGSIFASPSAAQVLAALSAIRSTKGSVRCISPSKARQVFGTMINGV
jgi:dihydroxyacetone kinase